MLGNTEKNDKGEVKKNPPAETSDPKQNAVLQMPDADKLKLTTILSQFFIENLPAIFSEQIAAIDTFTPLDVSGETATYFQVATSRGQKYFLKARSASKDESEMPCEQIIEKGEKERVFTQLLSKLGLPVVQSYSTSVVPPNALPAELEGIETKSFKGRTCSMILNLQDFSDGIIGRECLNDNQLQISIHANLGRVLGKINSLEVTGFGKDYDPKSNTFLLSWIERLNKMDPDGKITRLVENQIIDAEQGSEVLKIISPLKNSLPQAVLLHTDTNPGNYKHDKDGNITALFDWETMEGGPWQWEFAVALGRIQFGGFRVPNSARTERSKEFLRGYQDSKGTISNEDIRIVNACRAMDAVDRLHIIYVDLKGKARDFKPGDYLQQEFDTYKSTVEESRPDFNYMALSQENLLRKLIAQSIEGNLNKLTDL